MRIELRNGDEQLVIDNKLKRKCFGYLYFLYIVDEINIISFTEGSLRWFHKSFVKDWVFINATDF